MQGNNADRDLAERGIENTKKKEVIERSRRSENTDDGKPIPVPPGLVETPPKNDVPNALATACVRRDRSAYI